MDITVACRHWMLKLPQSWSILNEEECVTLTGDPDLGALQISAREKETLVDNDDLIAFASDRVNPESKLHPVVVGSLVGFYAQSLEDEIMWREWWLRRGRVMVYLTYNIEASVAGDEDDILEQMLSTLCLRPDSEANDGSNIFEHF